MGQVRFDWWNPVTARHSVSVLAVKLPANDSSQLISVHDVAR
jgi:hypothetical protein